MQWVARVAVLLAVSVAACGGDDNAVTGSAGAGAPTGGSGPDSGSVSGGAGAGGGAAAGPDATVDSKPGDDARATLDVSTSDALVETRDGPSVDTATSDGAIAAADTASETRDDGSSDTTAEAEAIDGTGVDSAEAGPPVSMICALACDTANDCGSSTAPYKAICDAHRCVSCIDDLPCIGGASVWTRSCSVDTDCTIFGDYCVDIGGAGRCAFDGSKIGTSSCFGNPSAYVIEKHSINDGGNDGSVGTVSVCARVTTTCDRKRGRCEAPCTITCVDGGACTNTCTVARGGKICNATTRRCECASDDDCASPTSHCNLVTLQCECASTNDCSPDGSALVCQ